MTAIVKQLTAIRMFSISAWFSALLVRTTARVFSWALSHRAVQKAIVDRISCSTKIGNALNRHVESLIEETDRDGIEADNITGLDRYIESCVDDYWRDNSIDTGSIKNFDQEVAERVDQAINELVDDGDEHLIRLIAQRLSY